MEKNEGTNSLEGKRVRSIDYIGVDGKQVHEVINTPEDAKRILKVVIDNEGKQLPDASYQIRDALFRNSDGQIDSAQAFVADSGLLVNYAPYSDATQLYLSNPNSWTPERRLLHDKLINKRLEKGKELSRQLNDREPTIYILRGNIASGKTTALKNHPHFARMRGRLGGVISPDEYKLTLLDAQIGDSKNVSDGQVHQESLYLAGQIQDNLLLHVENGKKTSLVIDKRFVWPREIIDLLKIAEDTFRSIDIFDVDTPLQLSVIRVLARPFPRPNLFTLVDGFERARNSRWPLIEQALENRNITYYILVDTGRGGITPSYINVYEVKRQKENLQNSSLYSLIVPKVRLSEAEKVIKEGIEKDSISLKNTYIDSEFIDKVRNKYYLSEREIEVLKLYGNRGLTLAEAIEEHSKEKGTA